MSPRLRLRKCWSACFGALVLTACSEPLVPPTTHLAFTVQPLNATGGGVIAPAVQVTALDSAGITATGFSGVVTVTIGTNPGAGTLTGTRSVAAVNGVANFSTLRINKAGTGYTLTAAARGVTGASSAAFDVVVGQAAQLVFTRQPSDAMAGAVVAPAVEVTVQDAGGNTVTGFSGNVTVELGPTPGGATLSGTTTEAAVSGVATFPDLSIQAAGSDYTLKATSGTLASAVSTPFAIAPPPSAPPSLHITTTTTGAALPNGYALAVDDNRSYHGGCVWCGTIGANSAVSVPVTAGSHLVELDMPGNCGLTGDTADPRTVTVNGPTAVPFSVTCLDTGSLRVTVTTTGTDPDPNGYYLCVSGGWCTRAHANDVVSIGGVTAEAHTVTIGDVAANCTVSGDTTQAITVPTHGTADVAYTLSCVLAERIAFSSDLGVITVMRTDGLEANGITQGFAPAWSSDGMKLAYECGSNLCIVNADGTGLAPLTTDGASNLHPTWSPDGTKLAFSAAHAGVADLWVIAANGTGAVQLTQNEGFVGSPAWSPDGTKIAFDCQVAPANDDICAINADGTGFTRLTSDPARDYGAAWKRDGTTLAFTTTRYGAAEIVLMSSTGGSVTRIGAGLRGSEPTWSPDGSQLAFMRLRLDPSYDLVAHIWAAHTDGSNVVNIATGDQPAWRPHP